MANCEWCDSIRINGATVVPVDDDDPTHGWLTTQASHPRGNTVCRACARDAVSGDFRTLAHRVLAGGK